MTKCAVLVELLRVVHDPKCDGPEHGDKQGERARPNRK